MTQAFQSRNEMLDAMAYVFLYSNDPSLLDPAEQKAFRDDIVRILNGVEEEISQSSITVQQNWFFRAKEKIEEGIGLFDSKQFREASTSFGQAEDIFRSGIGAHERKTDFIVDTHGTIQNKNGA